MSVWIRRIRRRIYKCAVPKQLRKSLGLSVLELRRKQGRTGYVVGSLAQKADREKCDFFVLDFEGRGVSANESVYRSVPFENQSESPESIWLLIYDPNKSAGSG